MDVGREGRIPCVMSLSSISMSATYTVQSPIMDPLNNRKSLSIKDAL